MERKTITAQRSNLLNAPSGTFNIHRSTIPPYIGHHKGDLEHQDPNIALLQVELHQDRLVAHSIHTQKKNPSKNTQKP
jgi:hypothetical protein